MKRERPCWVCGHDAIDHDLCNYGDCQIQKCICRGFQFTQPHNRGVMKEWKISEAMCLVMQYAERSGWIPIGHRVWTVGDWRVEVNGTRNQIGKIPPFHTLVENTKYMGMMVMHPYGGTVVGYKDTEKEFVEAMRAVVETLTKENDDGATNPTR